MVRRLTQAGQTIHSVHDLDGNRIAEYDYDDVTHAATLIREYVWLVGVAVAVVENGVVYYIRTDHIWRLIFATDGAEVKVWDATYLPFGGVIPALQNGCERPLRPAKRLMHNFVRFGRQAVFLPVRLILKRLGQHV